MANRILDPHLWNLESLFKFVYKVPVFQRPYSWDKEQIDVLLDDIFEAYYSEDKEDGYYTGNIIVCDSNEKINGLITKYEIIDGQQRITTFSLILMSLYSISNTFGVTEFDKTLSSVKSALWKYVNRKYHKEFASVSLNSIEKNCYSNLCDCCFDTPKGMLQFCETYPCSSSFDKRVVSNFIDINTKIKSKINSLDPDEYLDFADYLLQNIKFIVIEANCRENKVFSMFESINSKGKKLEEIDLIKTYIFSKLDENSYAKYLNIWGELIIRTHDNLYDYFSNYIKAYIYFYRQNISIVNFKSTCMERVLKYFHVNSEPEALQKLLDDMLAKVKFYNMLSSAEEANKLIKSNKFKFYYKVFTEISYKHPKALFLRTLIEFSEKKLNKNEVVEIVAQTVSFMMKFLSICNRDSKDAITLFSEIMNKIYSAGRVDKASIIYLISTELVKQNITPERLKEDLISFDAYEKNKKLTVCLLSLYEASTKRNEIVKTSYDQAYAILSSFSESFSLDHLLVQNPEIDSKVFMYYKDYENNTLRLREGQDFPETIHDGMDYDLFTTSILNRIGNLRIYYRDKNSGRKNAAISLKDCSTFTMYSNVMSRGEEITNTIIDYCLRAPVVKINDMLQTKRCNSFDNTNDDYSLSSDEFDTVE